MSESNFRIAIVAIIIAIAVALLAITADVMTRHPSIPWFIFGMVGLAVLEGIGYLVYRLVKYIREQ